MYFGVGISCAAFCFAWGLGWKDIRVEKKNAAKSETDDGDTQKMTEQ
jgi:hypothetical protein